MSTTPTPLTQAHKRAKIAEFNHWVWNPPTGKAEDYTEEQKAIGALCWSAPGASFWQTQELPDYFNDLNAMHEVWATVIQGDDELEDKFSIELLRAVGSEDPADGTRPNGSDAHWALASNATAAQRAEAFGLTLNLWQPGQ